MSESLSLSLCSHSSCCSVLPPRFLSCLPTYQITVLLLRSLSKMCTIYLFVYLSIFHLSTHCFLYSYSSFNIHFLSFLFIFFLLLFWSVDESMKKNLQAYAASLDSQGILRIAVVLQSKLALPRPAKKRPFYQVGNFKMEFQFTIVCPAKFCVFFDSLPYECFRFL